VTASLVGILLAAGRSTRFGSDKLLAPLPAGEPIALAAARHLRDGLLATGASTRLVAVVRPEQAKLAQLLATSGYELAVCATAHLGMGHSIAAGVAATLDAAGWVIALADMPAIRPASIARVATALQAGADAAAPFHAGRRGHPVGFAASRGEALLALTGDSGARALLADTGLALARVDTDDRGVLIDIDTRADLQAPDSR
jgi:molybdenum cofactor cytidylyltransferase